MAILVIILCSILVTNLKAAPLESSTESKIEQYPTEELVNDIVLPFSLLEILSNSVGVQFSVLASSLPEGTKTEREFLIIAAAVSKQWSDLRTTEYALKLFSKTLHSLIKAKADNNLSHWHILMKLDEAFSLDPRLSQQYEKLKEAIKRSQNVSDYHFISTNITEEEKKELIDNKYGPRMMLFRFLHALNKNKTYNAVAQTYFRLAKDSKLYEKVQRIFDEALKDSVSSSIDTGPEYQTRVVFSTLRNKLNNDEELRTVLQQNQIILSNNF
ncbi:hypothetical protein V9T40_009610 [Parthenolecanium corni]|uniref:Uncharacterized protein n=1 Tax=Parthenolecanium corni TaxID=536013 RepID=A0AAN9TN24_9HEMI